MKTELNVPETPALRVDEFRVFSRLVELRDHKGLTDGQKVQLVTLHRRVINRLADKNAFVQDFLDYYGVSAAEFSSLVACILPEFQSIGEVNFAELYLVCTELDDLKKHGLINARLLDIMLREGSEGQ